MVQTPAEKSLNKKTGLTPSVAWVFPFARIRVSIRKTVMCASFLNMHGTFCGWGGRTLEQHGRIS
jgi:hypothetical protein